MRALVISMVIASCAPVIDSPLAHQRALDRDDARALTTQLSLLPGVIAADAALQRPFRDPLSQATSSASGSIVLVVDARADRAELETFARAHMRAMAPEVGDPQIVIVLGGARPELASVGPFLVAARHREALAVTLAVVMSLLAVGAAYVAWRERP